MSCCEEQVSELIARVSLKAPGSPYVVSISGSGTTRTISIDVAGTGYYLIRYWLIDSSTPTTVETENPPSGGSTTMWEEITDANGQLSRVITHDSTGEWYVCVAVIAYIDDPTQLQFT